MCGIVGYVGKRPAVDILIRGLRRLEYRGYDSAGVAFLKGNKIQVHKAEGKLENVEKLLKSKAEQHAGSTCGIGHTRWATHGKPTTQNAHPHRAGHVVLVHNGIIENYQEIKTEIISNGHEIKSETDSELFGFLVLDAMEAGASLVDAVRSSFQRLEGACSFVVMSEKEPGKIVGVRNGSPLVVTRDPEGGSVLASDAQPLLEFSQEVHFLDHGDLVVATADGYTIYDLKSGKPITRPTHKLDWSVEDLDKQGYAHYMLKEIHEQPAAFVDTLNGILDRVKTTPFPLADQPAVKILDKAKEITLTACGTSFHACMVGKYWIEQFAQIPVNVELASEYRYRHKVLNPGNIIIGVTQSGETADTLAVIREVRTRGVPTIAITNVRNSSIAREANGVFYTSAGPEIAVAATKSYLTQMLTLLLIAGYLGLRRQAHGAWPQDKLEKIFHDIVKLPHFLDESLDPNGMICKGVHDAAVKLASAKGFFYIGRGYSFPIALEGALKLKEIAYVHAEGYGAGELKHGPIAMVDKQMAIVVLAPRDMWRDKTVSNLQEVKARGGMIMAVGDQFDDALKNQCDFWVPLPWTSSLGGDRSFDECLLPFIVTPVMQLLSYEIAVLRGTNVDKPRNLAKSVTVE